MTPAAQHVAYFIAGFLLGVFLCFVVARVEMPWRDRLAIRRATRGLGIKTEDLKRAVDGAKQEE